MINDFNITYSEGQSRKAQLWTYRTAAWSEFAARCGMPKKTGETIEQYSRMSRERQGEIKDVGGFVAAGLKDGRRKKANVISRTMLTYDLDYCDNAEATYQTMCDNEDCVAFLVYSTHKHTTEKPRLRVVVPLVRPIPAEQYEPVARKYAEFLGILHMCDPTTFETCRLFYWPSCSRDGEFFYRVHPGEALIATSVLGMYDADWTDVNNWPMTPHEGETDRMKVMHERRNDGKKVEDPLKKAGIIGAFCRAHSPIQKGIAELLPDVYTAEKGKFTYIGGSTHAGVTIITDDDGIEKWAYSYHNTDPAKEQLCNIFDLVRIHRFGELDDRKRADTATDKLPSYSAMVEYASEDPATRIEIHAERMRQCIDDFAGIRDDDGQADETPKAVKAEDTEWMAGVSLNKKGEAEPTSMNILYILKNDPKLKGLIKFNLMTYSAELTRKSPWGSKGQWTDTDDSCLRNYFERYFGICAKDKINDALAQVMLENQYHPVRDYLNALPTWDGTTRLDRLFVDYVGADDCELNKAVTRKAFTAAVKRVMEPGCKYDYCLTIVGKEGAGKSTAISVMAGKWFNDTMTTTEGKEGLEQLQGAWIVELGELAALRRSEVEQIKSFISSQCDNFRAAYARRKESHPRQCIFIGTTNDSNFLKGDDGNRRFWVLPINPTKRRMSIDDLRRDRDQLWAEALHYYRQGENLYLDEALEAQARERQKEFNDSADDPLESMLHEFLDMELPWGWYDKDIKYKREWLKNPTFDSDITYRELRKDFIPAEFVCERMGRDRSDLDFKRLVKQVKKIMENVSNWEPVGTLRHAKKLYGPQRGWRRIGTVEKDTDDDL